MLIGINTERSAQSLVGRFISIIIIGTLLSYGGALRVTQMNIERFGNIEFLKNARKDQSQTADSGFSDTDLSTTEAQITFLPIGLANLMFAPYPWQITSLRSAATLPEMFVWWLSMPFLFIGFWFAITKRFRQTLPVLIFTIMLTIGYSLFQGNAGTAYRQRTQIQVFLFMFIAVGWELKREKKENERIIDSIKKKKLEETIQQMRKDT
ncbi:MAG: hypothetical protein HC846_08790 [Blastocatellia bacterium]|nr:hypothetical protein [Blastocatellia bacterium]